MPIGRSGATVAESPVWRRLGLAALVVTFAAVVLAFALPWLPEGTPGGSALERYLPDRDSASRLGVVRGASGRTEGWETVTEARIPAFQAFGDLRNGFQNAISAFYARRAEDSVPVRELPDRLEDVQIVQSRTAPFVGFSGIAIIALGLVWDVLTFGPWVNRESAGLPRVSRLFIYIGYGLFGVTLINWSLTGARALRDRVLHRRRRARGIQPVRDPAALRGVRRRARRGGTGAADIRGGRRSCPVTSPRPAGLIRFLSAGSPARAGRLSRSRSSRSRCRSRSRTRSES